MLPLFKLYVGLSSRDNKIRIDREQVIQTVSRCVNTFTTSDAKGLYRGKPENTLIITIAHDSGRFVRNLAACIGDLFHQDAVGLEYDGCYERIEAGSRSSILLDVLNDRDDQQAIKAKDMVS